MKEAPKRWRSAEELPPKEALAGELFRAVRPQELPPRARARIWSALTAPPAKRRRKPFLLVLSASLFVALGASAMTGALPRLRTLLGDRPAMERASPVAALGPASERKAMERLELSEAQPGVQAPEARASALPPARALLPMTPASEKTPIEAALEPRPSPRSSLNPKTLPRPALKERAPQSTETLPRAHRKRTLASRMASPERAPRKKPQLIERTSPRQRPVVSAPGPNTPVAGTTDPKRPVIKETDPKRPVVGVTGPGKPVIGTTGPKSPVVSKTGPSTPVVPTTEPKRLVIKETGPKGAVIKETGPKSPVSPMTGPSTPVALAPGPASPQPSASAAEPGAGPRLGPKHNDHLSATDPLSAETIEGRASRERPPTLSIQLSRRPRRKPFHPDTQLVSRPPITPAQEDSELVASEDASRRPHPAGMEGLEGRSSAARSSLAQESALLRRALSQLAGQAPLAALMTLDRYQEAHPQGVLQSEAYTARLRALLSLGRIAYARALLEALPSQHPRRAELLLLRAELRAEISRCPDALQDLAMAKAGATSRGQLVQKLCARAP